MKVLVNNHLAVVRYCDQYIASRQYWIHNTIGGTGWRVTLAEQPNKRIRWQLELDDNLESHITMMVLKNAIQSD